MSQADVFAGRLKEKLLVHVAWDGRHNDNLEAEFDAYRATNQLFKFSEVEAAVKRDADFLHKVPSLGQAIDSQINSVNNEIGKLTNIVLKELSRRGFNPDEVLYVWKTFY